MASRAARVDDGVAAGCNVREAADEDSKDDIDAILATISAAVDSVEICRTFFGNGKPLSSQHTTSSSSSLQLLSEMNPVKSTTLSWLAARFAELSGVGPHATTSVSSGSNFTMKFRAVCIRDQYGKCGWAFDRL